MGLHLKLTPSQFTSNWKPEDRQRRRSSRCIMGRFLSVIWSEICCWDNGNIWKLFIREQKQTWAQLKETEADHWGSTALHSESDVSAFSGGSSEMITHSGTGSQTGCKQPHFTCLSSDWIWEESQVFICSSLLNGINNICPYFLSYLYCCIGGCSC